MLPKLSAAILLLAMAPALFSQQAPATPTIQVTTREIFVDVVVRDANGRVVPGLQQTDFLVKENGHTERVDFFEEHRSAAPLSKQRQLPAADSSAEGRAFSNVPPQTASTTQTGNIILLDLLNTPQFDQLRAIKQLLQFLKALPPGHPTALFLLTTRLEMLQGFTGSSDQLAKAAEKISSENMQMLRSADERMQMQDMIVEFAKMSAPAGHSSVQDEDGALAGGASGMAAAMEADMKREDDLNLAQRAETTEQAFAQLARATAGYPGRKNVLWMADEFPFGMETQVALDRAHEIPVVDNIPNLIADARMAVYPIYLGGVASGNLGAAVGGTGETSLVGGGMGSTLSPQMGDTMRDQFNQRAALHNSMDDLARATGGQAFYGTNDFAGALRHIVEDGSESYTLAYRSDNTKWDGRWRKISVDLAQRGYTLSYRRGYYAFPQAGTNTGIVQELNAAMQPGTLDYTLLQLTASVFPPDAKRPLLAVDGTLNASDLIYTLDAAGHRHAQVLVMLVALPDTGSEDKDRKQAAAAQTGGVLNLDLTDTQYRDLLHAGLRFRQQMPVKPGQYHLRLGVAQAGTHRIGTLDMPLTISVAPAAHM